MAALGMAGTNKVEHVEFAPVKRPAELSKLVGVDVRGFKHAASNQSMRHALKQHGNPSIEKARGQKALTAKDFELLPSIVRMGKYRLAQQRDFGPKRVEIHAAIDGHKYTYVAEARSGKRRLDMVTMWKK